MIYTFLNAQFLANMDEVLDENNISEITDKNSVDVNKLQVSTVLENFSSFHFLYLYEAVARRLKQKGIVTGTAEAIPLITKGGKKPFFFGIVKEDNSYTLYGQTNSSVIYFVKNYINGSNGLVKAFDEKNKKTVDKYFTEGKLSFINYFNIQLRGIHKLEAIIDKESQNIIDSFKVGPFERVPDESIKKLVSTYEMTLGTQDNFFYSNYIMTVFSFIEHVAILTTPFWFASKEELPYWRTFCNGFHPAGFDTYRDFWTTREDRDWIDSFIYTLCRFKPQRRGPAYPTANTTEEDKELKFLYDRLRHDYRNPIHHGFATGEKRTGLSMEVPSLTKKVIFNMAPMLKEVDEKAYTDTKHFLELFLAVFKKDNPEINEYLATGLNVPVDCTELSEFVLNNDMGNFIEQYSKIEEHYEDIVRYQAGPEAWKR